MRLKRLLTKQKPNNSPEFLSRVPIINAESCLSKVTHYEEGDVHDRILIDVSRHLRDTQKPRHFPATYLAGQEKSPYSDFVLKMEGYELALRSLSKIDRRTNRAIIESRPGQDRLHRIVVQGAWYVMQSIDQVGPLPIARRIGRSEEQAHYPTAIEPLEQALDFMRDERRLTLLRAQDDVRLNMDLRYQRSVQTGLDSSEGQQQFMQFLSGCAMLLECAQIRYPD